ncbi:MULTISPECIES: agmatinase [Rhodomicrobium]|uniref:agmatinase n=1 Tax=Rhodomicrobium TaxID=1068 RepID=UPI000B4B1E34|nr:MULTISPECIES: agmatinase [Rhodomicrobium]
MIQLRYRAPEDGFLGLTYDEAGDPEAARVVIIPFGLEASVSYGGGTAKGPEAIISASPKLEFFDEELWCEPYRQFGIATLEAPEIEAEIEPALTQLEGLVESVLAEGKFPLTLGGEHSLTPGAIRPFARRYPDLVVLQFDAHSDLRDGYLGEHYSHAAAMRRVLDNPGLSLVSVGIRATDVSEIPFIEQNQDRVSIHWAKDRRRWKIEDIVAPLKGRPVYISFDVDGFDASLMPATGTPEPGGFLFDEACEILRAASEAGTVVGADIVELAPIPKLHACEFTVAKLAYKLMSYAMATRPAV